MCHVLVLGPGWLTTRQGVLINHQLQPVLALWMLFCAALAHTPSPCNNTRSLSLILTKNQDPRHTMGKSSSSPPRAYIWNNAQREGNSIFERGLCATTYTPCFYSPIVVGWLCVCEMLRLYKSKCFRNQHNTQFIQQIEINVLNHIYIVKWSPSDTWFK